MSHFEYAIEKTLKEEGGYADNPNDSGGPTNRGISLRFLKDIQYKVEGKIITAPQLKKMTIEETKAIYKKYFWDMVECGKVQDKDIAAKLFDMCVNLGPSQACKLLQISLNRMLDTVLAVDGKLGPKTFACVDCLIAEDKAKELLGELKDNLAHFYINLAADKPKLKVFLKGWLARCQR